jgi:hypothetical protein
MFNRKKSNVEKIRNLKLLISKKYHLSDETIISIVELACHEPNCPPLETVITAQVEDGSIQNWRIAKAISEIEEYDINNLENNTN